MYNEYGITIVHWPLVLISAKFLRVFFKLELAPICTKISQPSTRYTTLWSYYHNYVI